jgi:hypothetical protein
MNSDEPDEIGLKFLIQLYQHVKGDQSIQASMYEIGELIGLDPNTASQVAEDLIGLQLVEIRTLSGGIGISAAGNEKAQSLVGTYDTEKQPMLKLDDSLILEEKATVSVHEFVDELKSQAGSLSLAFEDLTDLMADLKTIDVQMTSSRPKSAIVQECFKSVLGVLEKTDNNKIVLKLKALLGE